MFQVRASDTFWRTVGEIEDPALLREIHGILFQLVENGPDLPGASQNQWPAMGPVLVPGWSIDLPGGEGFIVYVSPETLGHEYVYVHSLVWDDWYQS